MDIEYDTYDPEPARRAALAALSRWPARRDRLPEERADLVATAWHTGARTVSHLAATADVDRSTIYADLAARGIDAKNRQAPLASIRSRGALPSAIAADLAEHVCEVVGPYLHPSDADDLTSAVWMLGKALGRVAETTAPNARAEQRADSARDLVACLNAATRHTRRHLATLQDTAALAAATRDDMEFASEDPGAVVAAASVQLVPGETGLAVTVDIGHGRDGYSVLQAVSADVDTTTPVTPLEHLELADALELIGDVLAARVAPAARGFGT